MIATADTLELLGALVATGARENGFVRVGGAVSSIRDDLVTVAGISRHARLGDFVAIGDGEEEALGEIVKVVEERAYVRLFDVVPDLRIGSPAWLRSHAFLQGDETWLGRVVDSFGRPIDGRGPVQGELHWDGARAAAIPALERESVARPITTGVAAVDAFAPICAGQRLGIFAGSGVGKSTLVSMFARSNEFDYVVVALVGERTREVKEFVEDVLRDNLRRSVVVVATSDQSAMRRRLAPATAMAVAERLRAGGRSVLLVIDSITRYAHALREIGIANGEPPVARGYPPSVFTSIARLLERAGAAGRGGGSITAVISVLVDGDDHNDPVSDSVRGILDGHVVLQRSIAEQGRFPAIDLLASLSRLANRVHGNDDQVLVRRMRRLISRYEESHDLRTIGAYKKGADPELDLAIEVTPRIYEALQQSPDDPPARDVVARLRRIVPA